MDSLSESQIKQLRKCFSEVQPDEKGLIGADGFAKIVRTLAPDFPPDNITSLMQKIDTDNDGKLRFEDFLTGFNSKAAHKTPEAQQSGHYQQHLFMEIEKSSDGENTEEIESNTSDELHGQILRENEALLLHKKTLEKKLASYEDFLLEAESKQESATQHIQDMEKNSTDLRRQLSKLQSENAALHSRILELESKIVGMESETSRLNIQAQQYLIEGKKDSVQKVSAMERHIENIIKEKKIVEKRNDELSSRIVLLEKGFEEVNSRYNELKLLKDEAEEQLVEAIKARDFSINLSSELNVKLDVSEFRNQEYRQLMDQYEERIQTMGARYEDMCSSLQKEADYWEQKFKENIDIERQIQQRSVFLEQEELYSEIVSTLYLHLSVSHVLQRILFAVKVQVEKSTGAEYPISSQLPTLLNLYDSGLRVLNSSIDEVAKRFIEDTKIRGKIPTSPLECLSPFGKEWYTRSFEILSPYFPNDTAEPFCAQTLLCPPSDVNHASVIKSSDSSGQQDTSASTVHADEKKTDVGLLLQKNIENITVTADNPTKPLLPRPKNVNYIFDEESAKYELMKSSHTIHGLLVEKEKLNAQIDKLRLDYEMQMSELKDKLNEFSRRSKQNEDEKQLMRDHLEQFEWDLSCIDSSIDTVVHHFEELHYKGLGRFPEPKIPSEASGNAIIVIRKLFIVTSHIYQILQGLSSSAEISKSSDGHDALQSKIDPGETPLKKVNEMTLMNRCDGQTEIRGAQYLENTNVVYMEGSLKKDVQYEKDPKSTTHSIQQKFSLQEDDSNIIEPYPISHNKIDRTVIPLIETSGDPTTSTSFMLNQNSKESEYEDDEDELDSDDESSISYNRAWAPENPTPSPVRPPKVPPLSIPKVETEQRHDGELDEVEFPVASEENLVLSSLKNESDVPLENIYSDNQDITYGNTPDKFYGRKESDMKQETGEESKKVGCETHVHFVADIRLEKPDNNQVKVKNIDSLPISTPEVNFLPSPLVDDENDIHLRQHAYQPTALDRTPPKTKPEALTKEMISIHNYETESVDTIETTEVKAKSFLADEISFKKDSLHNEAHLSIPILIEEEHMLISFISAASLPNSNPAALESNLDKRIQPQEKAAESRSTLLAQEPLLFEKSEAKGDIKELKPSTPVQTESKTAHFSPMSAVTISPQPSRLLSSGGQYSYVLDAHGDLLTLSDDGMYVERRESRLGYPLMAAEKRSATPPIRSSSNIIQYTSSRGFPIQQATHISLLQNNDVIPANHVGAQAGITHVSHPQIPAMGSTFVPANQPQTYQGGVYPQFRPFPATGYSFVGTPVPQTTQYLASVPQNQVSRSTTPTTPKAPKSPKSPHIARPSAPSTVSYHHAGALQSQSRPPALSPYRPVPHPTPAASFVHSHQANQRSVSQPIYMPASGVSVSRSIFPPNRVFTRK